MADWYDKTRKGYQDAMSVPQTDGITRLLLAMSGGAQKPKPAAPNYSAIPLNPFEVPFTGLRNEPASPAQGIPAFEPPGTTSAQYMPPMTSLPTASRQGNYGPAATPAPMPSMPPVTVEAPAPAPDTYADLGGYGGQPRMQSPQEMYGHLNPTPSLEEVFRREYAANPAAFGKLFG